MRHLRPAGRAGGRKTSAPGTLHRPSWLGPQRTRAVIRLLKTPARHWCVTTEQIPPRSDSAIAGMHELTRSGGSQTQVRGQTRTMQGWIGIIGVLAGGGIALLGQYRLRLADKRDELTALFLEQCAQLVALSEDYRNRVWEERRLSLQGRVAEWRLGDYRLAEARVKILCRDAQLRDALKHLNEAGGSLGKVWRPAGDEDEQVETAWRTHREALNRFMEASGVVIERGRIKRERGIAQ